MTRVPRYALLLAPFLAALVYLVLHGLTATAYDDSYFFKRVALHALQHGVLAWNVEDGPVHGNTSQLFQLVALGITAIAPTHVVFFVKLFNAACIVGLGVVLVRWSSEATTRPIDGGLVAIAIIGTPVALTTVTTGMETALALLLVALSLSRMVPHGGERPTPREAVAWTVATYLCRPDAAAILAVAWCVPALWRRELPWRFALGLTAAMALVWALLWAYYGTALPLPFYMKTHGFGAYGDNVARLGRIVKQRHFGIIVAFFAPMVWVASRGRRPETIGLLASSLLFWAYHLAFTNEIMGYHARFYAPGIIPLGMAAAMAWDEHHQARPRWAIGVVLVLWAGLVATLYARAIIPTSEGFFLAALPWPTYLAQGVLVGWLLLRPHRVPAWLDIGVAGVCLLGSALGWKPPPAVVDVIDDEQVLHRHVREVTTFRGIFDVRRCIPDATTIYHSELGVPGLVFPNAQVVDLVGLQSKDAVFDRRPFDAMCQADKPEAIFLPHRNYVRLNDQIRRSTCFRRYRRVVDASSSPLHIRRDLVRPFLKCATEVHRWRRPRKRPRAKPLKSDPPLFRRPRPDRQQGGDQGPAVTGQP